MGRHGRHRLRPLLPPGLRHDRQPEPEALEINADAIAYVVYLYASRKEVINEDARARKPGSRAQPGPFA